ncbi:MULTISPECIES: MarR family winged helix-turn-helix transcriptional regulator [unclassified Sporolactobacillus]|uniref:MarR family winged helix-turn-helix transcriptional regulator n=1 Tax=unclassified Sporolactobacillus TaxID=2628533 RepID=UPI0023680A8F|nr:MarR family transcriptional regulator [Sporolactobacillus sp. CQH2019]MDD9150156.1 MarR family transcriptional regulator [Sporolactobacillus sp. CQH2019]
MDKVFYLQDHLCFSLYACSRAILRMYHPQLKTMGITYPQYLVLLVLWEKDESTVKGLGMALDLDSGTLTPLLKRMEMNHLIIRERSKEDERVVNVKLTDTGSALREKAACIPLSLLESSGKSAEEIKELNETIKGLTRAILRNSPS